MDITIDQARLAKVKAGDIAKAAHASLSGVGITRVDGSYAVKVNLSEAAETRLPKRVDGVPIVYEVVGKIAKQALR